MVQLIVAFLLSVLAEAAHELCGKFEQYRDQNHTWNNNVWNDDGSGWTCTYVSDNPSEESNAFNVSWKWTGDPVVRGFPNVGLRTRQLPVKLSDLRTLTVSSTWEMSPASLIDGASADPNIEPNASALKANDVEANVCLDVFADDDRSRSLDYSEQKYEIMVWFGQFGTGALPVGNTAQLDPPVVSLIQDTEFKLYTGTNFNGQIVHTWVANRTLSTFDMDLAPLFGLLAHKGLVPVDVYLGTAQFGTEMFSATSQVEFSVVAFDAGLTTAYDAVDVNGNLVNSAESSNSNGTRTITDGVPIGTELANPTSVGSRSPRSILYATLGLALSVAIHIVICA